MTPRQQLIAQLEEFVETAGEGVEHAERVLELAIEHPNCCSRSLKIGHVTGSAWVVDETGAYVLLTHHRFLNKWLQLGGHVDDGETVLQAARREAKEESGLERVELVCSRIFDVDVHPIPQKGNEPAHYHHDVRYLFKANRDDPILVSEESHDVAWIKIADLTEYNDTESLARMARRWMTLRK